MSNEMIRYGRNALATDYTSREKVGSGMVKVGAGGLALWGVAAFIPFITLPMLLLAMVVFGLFV